MTNKALIANATKVEYDGLYATVPLDEMETDFSYQRMSRREMSEVNKLAREWNQSLYTPLLLSYRPKEDKFFLVDGRHRYLAAKMLGMEMLYCKIMVNQSVEDEAKTFVKQSACVVKLTPHQQLKGALRGKLPGALLLAKVCEEYGIKLSDNRSYAAGRLETLRCVTDAWEMADAGLENKLRWIFDVIKEAGWHKYDGSYNAEWFRTLRKICTVYDYNEDVKQIVIDVLKESRPKLFKRQAVQKFPGDGPQTAMFNELTTVIEQKITPKDKLVPLEEYMRGAQ